MKGWRLALFGVLCVCLVSPACGVAAQAPGPPPGAADYQAALTLIKQGKAKLALPLLWKAASHYHEAALWITMGYCYFEAGETEKSFAAYGIGLFYDPGNEEILKWYRDNGRDPHNGVIAVNWRPSREKVSGYNVYLQLFKDGQFVDYKLETADGASEFTLVDEELCDTLLHADEIRGRLHVTIGGTQHIGMIEHQAHEHEGHDDDHGTHEHADHDADDHDRGGDADHGQ